MCQDLEYLFMSMAIDRALELCKWVRSRGGRAAWSGPDVIVLHPITNRVTTIHTREEWLALEQLAEVDTDAKT